MLMCLWAILSNGWIDIENYNKDDGRGVSLNDHASLDWFFGGVKYKSIRNEFLYFAG